MTFLPKDYQAPQSDSNYMRLEEGKNKFRILSQAVVGWEYWNTNNKPVRSDKPFKSMPNDIRLEPSGQPSKIKHFWAFKVWDYKSARVKILQLTQATIQGAMKIKIDNRDGDAFGYDFIITRTGKGMETDYDIDVAEKQPLDPQIVVATNTHHVDLTALFRGEDPFTRGQKGQATEPASDIDSDLTEQVAGIPF